MPLPPDRVLPGVPEGTRVVVRYLIEGGERATDALGELVARRPGTLLLRTRHGDLSVSLDSIVAAKAVPPAPPRRPH